VLGSLVLTDSPASSALVVVSRYHRAGDATFNNERPPRLRSRWTPHIKRLPHVIGRGPLARRLQTFLVNAERERTSSLNVEAASTRHLAKAAQWTLRGVVVFLLVDRSDYVLLLLGLTSIMIIIRIIIRIIVHAAAQDAGA